MGILFSTSLELIPTNTAALPISGPGLQIEAGKQTMPKSGGNKDTEAGAGGGGASGQRKRRAGEDTGASSSSGGAVKTEQVEQGQRKRRAGGGGTGQELPEAGLGSGPRWDLKEACAAKDEVTREEVDKELEAIDEDKSAKIRAYLKQLEARVGAMEGGCEARCVGMLEQALSGSEDADVQFVFDGVVGSVRGHRGMLCAGSKEYSGMFRSGMLEEKEGKITVPPCVGVQSFRGFLEWVYLGRAGEECAKADGRELWILGEMYEVAGLREWLLGKGIGMGSLLGAVGFGVMPEGLNREGILSRCLDVVEEGGWVVDDGVLRGAGRSAMKGLVVGAGKRGVGRRLGWRYVRSGFRLLERWIHVNGGVCDGGDLAGFREIAGELDLLSMPLKALRETIETWRNVSSGWVEGLYERKEAAGDNAFEVEYKVGRRYDLGEGVNPGFIALHGRGSEQRMAVVDYNHQCVIIMNVESGKRVATAGSEGEGPGQFRSRCGVAFSGTGELYVGDHFGHRISVFDREGRYVRSFGSGEGQFNGPSGLCFTADGNLVVADRYNNRVQILREDGTLVRSFGSQGRADGQFHYPFDVSAGPDGSIAVVDCSKRVQLFDGEGRFVRRIGSKGDGPGQFQNAKGVAHGAGGEIIVIDCGREDVQVFSGEGELLQTIGAEGDSKVAWQGMLSVAVDAEGRIFFSDRSAVLDESDEDEDEDVPVPDAKTFRVVLLS